MSKTELDPEDRAWLDGVLARELAVPDDPNHPDERAAALAEELVTEALEPFRDLLPLDVYDLLLAEGVLRAQLEPVTAQLLADLVPGATQISHDRVRRTAEPAAKDASEDASGAGAKK